MSRGEHPGRERALYISEECHLCTEKPSVTKGPLTVNGRVYPDTPLCGDCAIDREEYPSLARSLLENYTRKQVVQALGLTPAEAYLAFGFQEARRLRADPDLW